MSECDLCGFPVGSDACNAKHGLKEERRPAKVKRSDFARGYYCAVAALINAHGCGAEARDLFRAGGPAEDADDTDKETFRKHGLMP